MSPSWIDVGKSGETTGPSISLTISQHTWSQQFPPRVCMYTSNRLRTSMNALPCPRTYKAQLETDEGLRPAVVAFCAPRSAFSCVPHFATLRVLPCSMFCNPPCSALRDVSYSSLCCAPCCAMLCCLRSARLHTPCPATSHIPICALSCFLLCHVLRSTFATFHIPRSGFHIPCFLTNRSG